MKDNLTSRVGRIISGSLNSLVDAVENAVPETVMEEAIREVDGAIDEIRAELGRIVANKHLANTRLMEENHKHEDLLGKIELAVKEGRDDLAEAAIASQLDIEAQIPVLENTISECGIQEKELEGYIAALQAKKREMREELRQFRSSRQEAATTSGRGASTGNSGVENSVTKAESAFERVMENTTGLAGRTDIGDRKTITQLAELDDMARKNRIQERLAAIKGDKK
ncbi:MAG: PspA/IM30 family protein [Aestuariibacter sp.]|nr:PspA/IM30 family protein [Aestuariibacter sp.]